LKDRLQARSSRQVLLHRQPIRFLPIMNDLAEELIDKIVALDNTEDLLNLSRVSTNFHQIVGSHLCRSVHAYFPVPGPSSPAWRKTANCKGLYLQLVTQIILKLMHQYSTPGWRLLRTLRDRAQLRAYVKELSTKCHPVSRYQTFGEI
jgi:hypothetical protein